MNQADFRTIDRDTLVDLRTVKINTDLPKEERIRDFIRQVGNPYCYRIGKYVVHLSFSGNSRTAQEIFADLARSKAGC